MGVCIAILPFSDTESYCEYTFHVWDRGGHGYLVPIGTRRSAGGVTF